MNNTQSTRCTCYAKRGWEGKTENTIPVCAYYSAQPRHDQ